VAPNATPYPANRLLVFSGISHAFFYHTLFFYTMALVCFFSKPYHHFSAVSNKKSKDSATTPQFV